jgi:hypothetical protein
MGTVSLHGLRVRRLERALRAQGVRDVRLVVDPSAAHVSRDAFTESVCTVLETYLAGKTTALPHAQL